MDIAVATAPLFVSGRVWRMHVLSQPLQSVTLHSPYDSNRVGVRFCSVSKTGAVAGGAADIAAPRTLQPAPYTLHYTPYDVRPIPCTLHFTFDALHATPDALRPTT